MNRFSGKKFKQKNNNKNEIGHEIRYAYYNNMVEPAQKICPYNGHSRVAR